MNGKPADALLDDELSRLPPGTVSICNWKTGADGGKSICVWARASRRPTNCAICPALLPSSERIARPGSMATMKPEARIDSRRPAMLASGGVSILIVGPLAGALCRGHRQHQSSLHSSNRSAIFGVRLSGVKIVLHGLENLRAWPVLHLHVESRFQSRSAGSDSEHSRPLFGAGEEGIVSHANPRHGNAAGRTGSCRSRRS